jgi:hypothetical protein
MRRIHILSVALSFLALQSSDAADPEKKKRKVLRNNDSSNATISPSTNAFVVEVESTDANATISLSPNAFIDVGSTDDSRLEPFIPDPMNLVRNPEQFLQRFEERGTFSGDISLTMVNAWLVSEYGMHLSIYVRSLDGQIPIRHLTSMETSFSGGDPLNILYNGIDHYESFEFVDDESLLGFETHQSNHRNVIEDHGTMYFVSTGDSSATVARVIRNDGDGDCLFHSVGESLSARGHFVDDVRSAVASHIRNNMNDFISYDDLALGTFEEWIEFMIDNSAAEAAAYEDAVAAAMARSNSK